MKLKLTQAPFQALQMTLSLVQALKILQMPQYELGQWLEEEIDQNPLLKRKEKNYQIASSMDPALLPKKISFHDSLTEQINELFLNPKEKQRALELMEDLDERGFLSTPTNDPILERLQNLEPAGVFARNLQESLEIQLKRKGAPFEVIHHHFDDLLHGRFEKIQKNFKIDMDLLKTLNLRPRDVFSPHITQWIIPDLEILKTEEAWTIQFKEEFLPSFTIDPTYLSLKTSAEEEKKNIHMWKYSASAIFQALKKRKQILFKVAQFIIKIQYNYLDQKGALIPCTLSEAAIHLKMHISTLSRAIQDKSIITPLGILPLRFFFQGKDTCPIKELIQQHIKKENPKNPITDDKLALLLQKANVQIARRTIAKYRKELGIPQASYRKLR